MFDLDLHKYENQEIDDIAFLFLEKPTTSLCLIERDWADVLEKIHKNTFRIDYGEIYRSLGPKGLQDYITDYIHANNIKVIYVQSVFNTEFDVHYLEQLREHCFLFTYFGDVIEYFNEKFLYIAQAFDLVLVDNYYEKYEFILYGIETLYALPCCDPEVYDGELEEDKNTDVSFVGRLDRLGRKEYLHFLGANGVNVEVAGTGSERGPLNSEEMIRLYKRSKINLNFSGIQEFSRKKIYKKLTRMKGVRCVEIALSGSFLLSEYTPGLEKLFKIGEEIDVFHDEEELLEKIQLYLHNDILREGIADRGYQRALADYDSRKTWKKLLQFISYKAAHKNYRPSPIYLDDEYLKMVSTQRAVSALNFLRQRQFRLAWEEIMLIVHSKKIAVIGTLWAMFREVFRPIVNSSPVLKRTVAKIRSFRAAPILRR